MNNKTIKALAIIAEQITISMSIYAKIEGMKALNQSCRVDASYPAWSYDDFEIAASKLKELNDTTQKKLKELGNEQ